MVPKRTHLKTDNQTQLNPKLDDTSVDKPIKKVITFKNLLTHWLTLMFKPKHINESLSTSEQSRTNRTVIKNPYDKDIKNNHKTTS